MNNDTTFYAIDPREPDDGPVEWTNLAYFRAIGGDIRALRAEAAAAGDADMVAMIDAEVA